jgi:baculoviral IAP repeat-containing protein 6
VQDGSRPDKMRAALTGPRDTPYSGGVFMFDMYIPPEYPNVPPLVYFATTGCGRVRQGLGFRVFSVLGFLGF